MAEREGVGAAPIPSGESWDLAGLETISTSAVSGKVLAAMGDEDPDIVVLTADLKFSNQTVDFERAHPERFINVGISEQHMVTMAAGMASVGMKPYVATFAPFVGLLAGEHIRTDLAYPGLPVRVIAHHAGIAIGFYGTSHHATEDLGLMRSIAGLTVVCPCDAIATERALRQTADIPGPVYFRVGRGRDVPVYDVMPAGHWKFGEAAVLREGADLTIVANGVTVSAALEAARDWSPRGSRPRSSTPTRCARSTTRRSPSTPGAASACWSPRSTTWSAASPPPAPKRWSSTGSPKCGWRGSGCPPTSTR